MSTPRTPRKPMTAAEMLSKARSLLEEGESAAARDALHYGNASGADRARRARELAKGWCRLAESANEDLVS